MCACVLTHTHSLHTLVMIRSQHQQVANHRWKCIINFYSCFLFHFDIFAANGIVLHRLFIHRLLLCSLFFLLFVSFLLSFIRIEWHDKHMIEKIMKHFTRTTISTNINIYMYILILKSYCPVAATSVITNALQCIPDMKCL